MQVKKKNKKDKFKKKDLPIADHSRVTETVDISVQVWFGKEPPLITS